MSERTPEPDPSTPATTTYSLTTPSTTLTLTRRLPAQDTTPQGALLIWPDTRLTSAQTCLASNGLACWLARYGFDVGVIDASPHHPGLIDEVIPSVLKQWATISGHGKFNVVAQGWTGVALASSMARAPELRRMNRGQILLGSRRHRSRGTAEATPLRELWKTIRSKVRGYEHAKPIHPMERYWLKGNPWQDSDGLDYGKSLIRGGMPPTLFVASEDAPHCTPGDAARFRDECGPHQGDFLLLGTACGFSRDYSVSDMLADPDATKEVYPRLLDWLMEY
ncbi:hypothetical protein [Larsenimonas salina]|uniref:hypothetical protein n=1 Tax=Larsenimonas salina TaxID=1295565 RepID=UPI00207304A0|nr:hypothetical protein [Larsenimonas salina]MCM5703944.1 hypothetical protein [Larsenimonas salina]